MPKRSRDGAVADPHEPLALPPELERRLKAAADAGATADFDAFSWLWMALLGLVLPLGLVILGWWLGGPT